MQRESLLSPTAPWEAGRASAWSALVHHEGRFHLWYDAYAWDPKIRRIDRATHCYCYAVSQDGVHFERPDVGLFEVDGIRDNNAVMRGTEGGPVFVDPFAPPERRFRAIIRRQSKLDLWDELVAVGTHDTWMLTSPDGMHWRRSDRPMLPFWLGATQSVIWDDRLAKWVLYLRAHVDTGGATRRAFMRVEVARDALDDPLELPEGCTPPDPGQRQGLTDQWPIVLDADDQDMPGAQVYVSNIIRYARADELYLAFIPMWYDSRNGDDASDMLEVQLGISRDGITWRRPWRRPLVTPGTEGTASAGQVFPVQDPVIVADEFWLYFHGLPEDHMSAHHEKGNHHLARAIWKRDRFVSVEAFDREAGELTTGPLRFTGRRLAVNANAGASGWIRVAIERPDGTAIEGFTDSEARTMHGNRLDHDVTWETGARVSRLAGQPVRLRFTMQASRLYGFQFRD
ncbi:MAG: hypothetical protein CMJ18_18775 [Phycisphaeraceae bacterium]|nr:hypothetical protein [Phycisphaeraceae bacterium]